ncbi:MAG TPA: hypothetical protein VMF91_14415 [Bryobacteraceae bacterium]|nr:hypothetical protein [Bryobacteraceae bacterium]
MTDQLFLSLWLHRHSRGNRAKYFEQLLRLFPFSQRDQPQSTVSIHAVDSTQPLLLEQAVNGPLDPAEIMQTLRDYEGDDVAYRVESWWDLWQFDGREWRLAPTRVALSCFGPEFDAGAASGQEDLRIDFGVDSNFLPAPDLPGSATFIESNIKSLLRLVHEVESVLPVARRRLETESGENFADRLQGVLKAATAQ